MKFIDIGCNLLDAMYKGQYNGKLYHDNDLGAVLERARAAGVKKIIVTAGNLEEAKEALAFCQGSVDLFCTAGIHPTRAREWSAFVDGPEKYMEELCKVIEQGIADGKVVAIGECGLDYDRVRFCDEKTQQECFLSHFTLSQRYNLPLFLHLRSAGEDFLRILEANYDATLPGGVVHSFDGSFEELNSILKYDSMYIGINGCSLKTEDNLNVARSVPMERLMLETDAPWCSIRTTHASSAFVKTKILAKDKKKHSSSLQVKGRNEPCNMVQVLEVISGLSGLEKEVVADYAYRNSEKLFFRPKASP
eukprot:jgi/Picsp_1/4314/NSC_01822-R1_related dnase